MGQDIEPREFTGDDRRAFRKKLEHSVRASERMLASSKFESGTATAGFELELNLVDADGGPAMRNTDVLRGLGDPSYQTELARFNLEANLDPRRLAAGGLGEFEADCWTHYDTVSRVCADLGIRPILIGILPTVLEQHINVDTLSANTRYRLLNEQIVATRGEDIAIDIRGVDRLVGSWDSVAGEAACTSTQLHVQVSPELFAAYWNAAQAIAGPQVALCANAPFFCGRELWQETRITLFQQAIDSRSPSQVAAGARPRVWFGERWIDSVTDLWDENLRYFPPLLPVCEEEEPLEALERGVVPKLWELRLHNGTIWRWNRPVYDVRAEVPHLRVENRVLSSGPTISDTIANAAFWYGLVRRIASDEPPITDRLEYPTAAANFFAGAEHGLDARQWWPGVGEIGAAELITEHLLPLADEGLRDWQVDVDLRQRYLGIIADRCATGQNGAAWQSAAFHHRADHSGVDRLSVLRSITQSYIDLMHAGLPVHQWPTD